MSFFGFMFFVVALLTIFFYTSVYIICLCSIFTECSEMVSDNEIVNAIVKDRYGAEKK